MSTAIDTFSVINKELLAYKGMLYPSHLIIKARAASLNEIRKWVTIDTKSPISVHKHIHDIVTACITVESSDPTLQASINDIYEHDKIALLFIIFDKTFPDKSKHNVFISARCPHCKKEFPKLVVTAANLTYKNPDEKYAKYIDSGKGCFVIPTKSFGTIEFKPSTIGVGSVAKEWVMKQETSWIEENQDVIMILQALCTDWRGLTPEIIRKKQIEEYNLWTDEQKLFWSNLLHQLNVLPQDSLEYICSEETCRNSFRSPMQYSIFNRELFAPIQSFDSELL